MADQDFDLLSDLRKEEGHGSQASDPSFINVVNQLGFQDSFGKLIADGTTNELDIASHYPYTPERWRLFVDGSRVFPEYGNVAQYNHDVDIHQLMPAAGETVVMESAERPRYIVGYEQLASQAFQINQSLAGSDIIQIGYFDGDDGYYVEQTTSHADDQVDLVIERGGTVVDRQSNVQLGVDTQTWARYAQRFNWYNAGGANFTQFFTQAGASVLQDLGFASVDGGRGPQVGNLRLHYRVTADASTTGLVLGAGSVSLLTLGQAQGIVRVKGADFVDTVGTTGAWVPIRAFRQAPGLGIVDVQVTALDALSYSAADDIRLLAQVFPSEKVTFGAGSWGVPPEWLADNNALQTRTDVSQIADSTGTLVASAADPGGYQVGRSVLLDTEGFSRRAGEQQVRKRSVPQDTVLVILALSGTTGDATYEVVTEQDF